MWNILYYFWTRETWHPRKLLMQLDFSCFSIGVDYTLSFRTKEMMIYAVHNGPEVMSVSLHALWKEIQGTIRYRINSDNGELEVHNSTEGFWAWHKLQMWNFVVSGAPSLTLSRINSCLRPLIPNSWDFLFLFNTWTSPFPF